MTPEEARQLLDNDPDLRGSHYLAISVLEESAMLAERERCAKVADSYAMAGGGIVAIGIAEKIRAG